VDSLVQAALGSLVGAVVGELVLGRQLGRRAMGWGALFAAIPNADWVLTWFFGTARGLWLYRSLFHSVFLMIAAAVFLAKPMAKRWKKEKVTLGRAGLAVVLACAGHVLIDVLTVEGARIFFPFPGQPVSCDVLGENDFVIGIPLLVAVITGFFVKPKEWKKGKGLRSARWCLGIAFFYVALCFGAKHLVSRSIEADLARRGVTWQRKMEAPTSFGMFFWRSVVERPGEIRLGYRSIFDSAAVPVRWILIPKGDEAAAKHADAREVGSVKDFSQGWWIAREAPGGLWMVDMRFGEGRAWDSRGMALRPSHAWSYLAEDAKDRLHFRSPDASGGMDMVRRMGRRVVGETEAWDLSGTNMAPRLIGNPGVLQEYLPEQR
jgi:inner membrane protein